ncbi:AbrB family looped-hinge helix DNA binding protein [Stella humosa]|uniref:AbrB family looped-hinge helix DNA binding protein n=1 Tax=Stella humosa TaxID=94 RepID=A0A3N1MA81_9PROT|nr:AbrB/MazE/SpoVT family DNA-binding domain-containing protein [Stella humosa]ROP99964.1 AbrB family looped-hinge helix DNA binding protein [Stella humosa]BBK30805.1 hypothetical protein STHU_14390 [Stella humosa]
MATLTVTAKGQITLKKELLQHLGVRPGQKLHVDKLPGGSITVRPAETGRSIRDIFGTLRCEGTAPLSIEEIARIAEEGWAGRR